MSSWITGSQACWLVLGLGAGACTGGAVVNSNNNYARVGNATVTWGTNLALSGQTYSMVTGSDGLFHYNTSGDLSVAAPSGQSVVKVNAAGKNYIYLLDHEYNQSCSNGTGGTVPCSEDIFDIGNSPTLTQANDSTWSVTPTTVPIHTPDYCLSACANSGLSGSQLAACQDLCSGLTITDPMINHAIVYGALAPSLAGGPAQARITAKMTITNTKPWDVMVSRIDVLGHPVTHFSTPLRVPAFGTAVAQNCGTFSDKPPVPGSDVNDVCLGYDPLIVNMPVPAFAEVAIFGASPTVAIAKQWIAMNRHTNDSGPLGFMGRADDLAPNETFGASSQHPGSLQFFAFDLGATGWNAATSAFELVYPGADLTKKESFRIYGKPMYAIADGAVCWALNDQPEKPVHNDGTQPPSPSLGTYYGGGDQIFIKSGNEISVVAHLQPGSIPDELMVPNAPVRKGQYIGKSGYSGDTSDPAPHVHVKTVPAAGAPIPGAFMNNCDAGVERPMGFSNLQSVTQSDAHTFGSVGAPLPWTQLDNQSAPSPYGLLFPSVSPFSFCPSCTDSKQYIGVLRAGSSIEVRIKSVGWSAFVAAWAARTADAFRLTQIETFFENNQQQFVGIFTRSTGALDVAGPDDLVNVTSWAQLSSKIAALRDANRRLVDVVTYLEGSTRHFVGVFRPGTDQQTVIQVLGGDAFTQQWDTLSNQNLRLTSLTTYDAGGGQRQYIGAFRAGSDGYALWSGMGWTAFTNAWATLRAQGLRLVDIESFPVGAQRQYTGVYRSGSDGDALFSTNSYASYVQQMEHWAIPGLRLTDLHVEQ
jgi:hypothetical protein